MVLQFHMQMITPLKCGDCYPPFQKPDTGLDGDKGRSCVCAYSGAERCFFCLEWGCTSCNWQCSEQWEEFIVGNALFFYPLEIYRISLRFHLHIDSSKIWRFTLLLPFLSKTSLTNFSPFLFLIYCAMVSRLFAIVLHCRHSSFSVWLFFKCDHLNGIKKNCTCCAGMLLHFCVWTFITLIMKPYLGVIFF